VASAIGICNLAIAHLGQQANITSISPPEGSVEAEYCATFYPIARDTVLENFAWTFASRRAALGLLSGTISPWLYSYSLPADCMKPRRVLPAEACSDHAGVRFLVEDSVIYTNEPNAELVYTYFLTDTTKFSPKFVLCLSRLLASFLAGPILRDTTGRAAGLQHQLYLQELGKAESSNANSDRNPAPYLPGSVAARLSNYPGGLRTYPPGDDTIYPAGFEVK
jgi:hypothetical protein